MSKQVLDRLQMRHLHELGLDTSKASAYWHNVVKFEKKKYVTEWIISLTDSVPLSTKTIPAFTLQDILDVLPKDISREGCTWSASLYIDYENNRIAYGNTDRDGFEIYHEVPICENIIDAAYEMLCWVLTNKYIQEYE